MTIDSATSTFPARPEPLGGVLVAAFERCWSAIQVAHPDVPDVVMTLASGVNGRKAPKYGHFHAGIWHGRTPETAEAEKPSPIPEVLVGGEGLAREPVEVLGTLLHEAAHGIAHEREIKDTSRQGRFHNKKFKALAEEVGIAVQHDKAIGWSLTTVPEHTAAAYAAEVDVLAAALLRYRDARTEGRTSRKSPPLVCACERAIRVSKKVRELGPIVCGVCGEAFAVETDDADGIDGPAGGDPAGGDPAGGDPGAGGQG